MSVLAGIASLKDEIESPPNHIVRKLIIARTRIEARACADRIFRFFPYLDAKSTLNEIPCISRNILPLMQEKAFQTENDQQWASDQLDQVARWRKRLLENHEAVPPYNWVLAIPTELLRPETLLPNCSCDGVPIEYRIQTLAHLLKPVFEDIAKDHELAPTMDVYRVHAIGLDCFYHKDTVSASDLAHYFISVRNEPTLFPDDAVENDRNKCHHVKVEVWPLEETLNQFANGRAIARDALFARVFLVKKAIASQRQRHDTGEVTATPRKALKGGDVILFEVAPENPALHWCKFGSTAQLEKENKALATMRNSSDRIGEFLYEISSVISLEADYTSILVSRHAGSHKNDLEVLEDWLRDRGSSDFTKALGEIDRFFRILHVSPTDSDGSSRPRFDASTGWAYERLLATRRTEPVRERNVIPVKNEVNGRYKLLYIRPRDVDGAVEFCLEDVKAKNLTFLSWECKDWRWRLWKEGIAESTRVELNSSVRLHSKSRHLTHLGEIRLKYPHVFDSIQRAFDKFLNKNTDRIKSFWVSVDLFPVWLHGDFHPRNALLVPTESGRIERSDSTRCELKIIDLAEARTSDNKSPMAIDFVTFEVDMKARGLYGLWPSDSNDIDGTVGKLEQSERQLWAWCRRVLPRCSKNTWQTEEYRDKAWEPPKHLPRLAVPAFSKVAVWRHLSLSRLYQSANRAIKGTNKGLSVDDWTPIKSYAQALFFYNIGYLEFLNPKDGEDKMRALSCLVSAAVAADLLADEPG